MYLTIFYFSQEVLSFNINYFALHIRAYRFLSSMAKELKPGFIKYFGPDYLKRENELPFLVAYIFREAVRAYERQEDLPRGSGLFIHGELLKDAAKLMNEVIASTLR